MGASARFSDAEPVRRGAGLVGDAGTIAGHYAITEWLEEKGGALPLMPSGGLPAPRCAV